jgi:NADP-dependent 3-hydroxy acid dehydrogenase YdfG
LQELNKGATKVLAVVADLTVERDVENLFQEVNKVFDRPADVVIANAGQSLPLKPVAEESVSTWWKAYVS